MAINTQTFGLDGNATQTFTVSATPNTAKNVRIEVVYNGMTANYDGTTITTKEYLSGGTKDLSPTTFTGTDLDYGGFGVDGADVLKVSKQNDNSGIGNLEFTITNGGGAGTTDGATVTLVWITDGDITTTSNITKL